MNELDELFNEAKAAYLTLHPSKRPSAPSLGKYRDPDNWIRTRNVALIHQETLCLLGNYGEFLHATEDRCRKLVREPFVLPIWETETVSGKWWLPEEPLRLTEPVTQFHTRLHVRLAELRLHAPKCEVVAQVDHGAVRGIKLVEDTMFAQIDLDQPQLVFFPKGTEIMKEMARGTKKKLFERLMKEEAA